MARLYTTNAAGSLDGPRRLASCLLARVPECTAVRVPGNMVGDHVTIPVPAIPDGDRNCTKLIPVRYNLLPSSSHNNIRSAHIYSIALFE